MLRKALSITVAATLGMYALLFGGPVQMTNAEPSCDPGIYDFCGVLKDEEAYKFNRPIMPGDRTEDQGDYSVVWFDDHNGAHPEITPKLVSKPPLDPADKIFTNGDEEFNYFSLDLTPSTDDSYTIMVKDATIPDKDTAIFLYKGDYNPGAPLTNLIAGNDDINTVGEDYRSHLTDIPLFGGTTYTIVVTSYEEGVTGTVFFEASSIGGGSLVVVDPTVPNAAPTASPGTLAATEDTPQSGTLTGSDPEGSPLTFSIVSQGGKGTATITNASTGAYTYTPNPNENGSDSFTFKVNDGSLDSAPATVAVTITAVNDAPTATAGTLNVTENAPQTGTLIGSDPEGDPLTFSIVSQGSKGTVAITGEATGAYTYTPNANETGSDTFTFKVNDGEFDSAPATVTVTIEAVNDAPTNIALSHNEVAENRPMGTTVGTLTATDPDAGDTFEYALVSGDGSTDNGSFAIVGNALRTNEIFDFETKPSYSVRIRVTDGGGLSFEKVFDIYVTDANDAPTIQGAAPGQTVNDNATISPFSGIAIEDADSATVTVKVTLDMAAKGGFSAASLSSSGFAPLSGESGVYSRTGSPATVTEGIRELVFEPAANRVAPGLTETTMFSIEVDDGAGGEADDDTTTVISTSMNDAPTDIALSAANVAENEDAGAVVGTLSATDADTGEVHSFSLTAGEGDDDNAQFEISGNQLRTKAAFDFETKSSYAVRVQVKDAAEAAFEKEFAIAVTNVNEKPKDLYLSGNEVSENQPAGTTVGTLTATDPDAGDTFTYTLASGTGDTDNDSFAIVGNALQTSTVLDFETKSHYSVRIRVTDGGALEYEEAFVIVVTDANDAPTIQGAAPGQTVNDNATISPFSGIAIADADSATVTVKVTVDHAAKGAFTAESLTSSGFVPIDGQSGVYSRKGSPADVTAGIRVLVFAPAANRVAPGLTETTTLAIEVDDGAGGEADDDKTTVVSTSMNDAPTNLTLNNGSVRENLPVGTVVGTLTAVDADPGETFAYSLVSGDGGADNGSFTIEGNELKTAERFAFSTKNSYSVRIQVSDANGGSHAEAFVIAITRQPATSTGTGSPTQGTVRVVNVVVGAALDVAAKVEIVRTATTDGKQVDKVNFDSAKANEAAAKAVESGRDFARIVIEDIPDNAADEVVVDVPKASLTQLANRNINLEIQTQDVKLTLPRETLSLLHSDGTDLFFRLFRCGSRRNENRRSSAPLTRTKCAGSRATELRRSSVGR